MTVSGTRARSAILTTFLLLLAGCAKDYYPQTTFEPVSAFGEHLNRLFANTFWWTLWIMVLVEVLILYFIFRYRARPDAPEPKQIHGHTGLEIAWTILPAIIVVFIAVPTVAGIFTTQAKASPNALQVEVVGHQWWWEFRYPQLGVVTANELVLPVGREVELKMWSADVIHSYWIPKIGGKRDVNPQPRARPDERGKYNYLVFTVDKAGYYLGQCAEFCGTSHAIMRTSALAMNQNDFAQWASSMGGAMPGVPAAPQDTAGTSDTVNTAPQPQTAAVAPAQQRPSGMSPTGAPAPGRADFQSTGPIPPGTMARRAMIPGEQSLEETGRLLITSKMCVACHAINNTTMKGTLGPNLTRFGARRYLGAGARPNTMENLVDWIRHPQGVKEGALMPGTRDGAAGMPATGLSEAEINAVAAYLLSLK